MLAQCRPRSVEADRDGAGLHSVALRNLGSRFQKEIPPEKDVARRFGKRIQKAVHTGGKLRRDDGILNLR